MSLSPEVVPSPAIIRIHTHNRTKRPGPKNPSKTKHKSNVVVECRWIPWLRFDGLKMGLSTLASLTKHTTNTRLRSLEFHELIYFNQATL